MSNLESVLVVVETQPQVVQIADEQLLVIDGPAPVQVVEVPGVVPDDVVVLSEETLTLLTVAEQGPAGGGGAGYQHAQPIASASWVVNHNLGTKPLVQALSVGGMAMVAEVIHASDNQAVIYFDAPTAGVALCS